MGAKKALGLFQHARSRFGIFEVVIVALERDEFDVLARVFQSPFLDLALIDVHCGVVIAMDQEDGDFDTLGKIPGRLRIHFAAVLVGAQPPLPKGHGFGFKGGAGV